MALPELLAALRHDGEAEVSALIGKAHAEATALRTAARQAAARRREAALAGAERRWVLDTESAVTAAAANARAEELAARARVLARARDACRDAAESAQRSLPPPALRGLLAAALRYLPADGGTLRCPASLLATAGEACRQGAGAVSVELAPVSEGLALVSGDWRVELGLASLLDARWPQLAARLLRDLEST